MKQGSSIRGRHSQQKLSPSTLALPAFVPLSFFLSPSPYIVIYTHLDPQTTHKTNFTPECWGNNSFQRVVQISRYIYKIIICIYIYIYMYSIYPSIHFMKYGNVFSRFPWSPSILASVFCFGQAFQVEAPKEGHKRRDAPQRSALCAVWSGAGGASGAASRARLAVLRRGVFFSGRRLLG